MKNRYFGKPQKTRDQRLPGEDLNTEGLEVKGPKHLRTIVGKVIKI
jgi:hypothetical protein